MKSAGTQPFRWVTRDLTRWVVISLVASIKVATRATCPIAWNSLDDDMTIEYHQTSNIRCTSLGNKIFDHSDVVGALPVGAAPTTSSFSTQHLASTDYTKTSTVEPLYNTIVFHQNTHKRHPIARPSFVSSKPDPYPTPVDVVVYLISAIMNRVIKRFYCIRRDEKHLGFGIWCALY